MECVLKRAYHFFGTSKKALFESVKELLVLEDVLTQISSPTPLTTCHKYF